MRRSTWGVAASAALIAIGMIAMAPSAIAETAGSRSFTVYWRRGLPGHAARSWRQSDKRRRDCTARAVRAHRIPLDPPRLRERNVPNEAAWIFTPNLTGTWNSISVLGASLVQLVAEGPSSKPHRQGDG